MNEDKRSAKSNKELVIDVSQLKGNTLEKDLRQRGFIINAIVAPLDEIVRHFENTWIPVQQT